MSRDRTRMTGRVVPLSSPEAADARVEGTIAERVALVRELSDMMWARTGRPLPRYTRATMPVHLTTLQAQADHD